jgi:ketosteroid isomerase-like protein
MRDRIKAELIAVEHDWGRAMVANHADAIGRFMADDWAMIGPDGGICGKTTFLGLVSSGAMTHDVMEADEISVRVYGDAAVLTARGLSGGMYRGQAFRVVERVTDVYVRRDGRWPCVHAPVALGPGSIRLSRLVAV